MAMTMRQVQNLLQYLGYYDGRVDGINGPLTEQAVAAFRADNGNPNLGDELAEVLIGADGNIVGGQVGVLTEEQLRIILDAELAKTNNT